MKKLFILGSFLFFTVALCAQSNYFIFIHSENNQPYYVQVDGKTLSSSQIGHLIIPGLKDSLYTLHIGFPKNQFPEQWFQLAVNRKDGGYQLKHLGGEGWALVNMQSLQLTKASQPGVKKQTISYGDLKKTDNFSTLMAGLVNDSAVLYTSLVKVESPKESSSVTVQDVAVSAPVKPVDDVKSDSVQKNAEVVSQTDIIKKDTSALISRKEDPVLKDSIAVTGEVSEPEIAKKDSAVVQNQLPKVEPEKDTVSARNDAKLPEKDSTTMVAKLPSMTNKPLTADTSLQVQIPATPIVSPIKPLIVWFSETRTSNGTELVYFDMSLPDKTDTIKILIPPDSAIRVESGRDASIDSNAGKKENEKSGAGKFIGKIFNKKNDPPPVQKEREEEKKSTIKVTTVEKTRSDTSSLKSKDETGAENGQSQSAQKDSVNKNTSGKFLGRLFGKKNNTEPPSEKTGSAPNTSTIKVTTIDSPKKEDTGVTSKVKSEDETNAELKKLKKAQEEEEKTSTERFFGKIFGKKKKESDKDSVSKSEKRDEVVFKVTDVNPATRRDTAKAVTKEQKAVVVNSDCTDFATDNDVDKLKIKLLSRKNIDAQIIEAKKFFKTKCVSTKQVKTLSTLYKTDAEKYKLFDASYPFVSDSDNFMDLVVLLTEPYYINRFIAMVRM